MSLKPIDMQVSIAKTQDIGKQQAINSDKFALQDAYKNEMDKNAEKKLTEVNKSDELDKLVDENGHNRQQEQKDAEEGKKKRKKEKEQRESEEFARKVTNRGNLFDFKA